MKITVSMSKRFFNCSPNILKELSGHTIFLPIIKNKDRTHKELKDMHFDKILRSDILFVFNPDNKIGTSVSDEIDFAKSNNIRVLYYSISEYSIIQYQNSALQEQ